MLLTEQTLKIIDAAEDLDFDTIENITKNLSHSEKDALIPLVESAMFFANIKEPIHGRILHILKTINLSPSKSIH